MSIKVRVSCQRDRRSGVSGHEQKFFGGQQGVLLTIQRLHD
jgi:hypothetical protein